MIILDTNVVSEASKPAPNVDVAVWIAKQRRIELFVTAITKAEMLYGVAILPPGRRRDELGAAIDQLLEVGFRDRILPFDAAAAEAYAEIASRRRAKGRPPDPVDGQIAAIALASGAALATRNIRDFEGSGIDLIDPWTV